MTANMSDNGEGSSNYSRLISMVIDLGTETVLEVFNSFIPRQNVREFLSESIVKSKLEELQRRKILKLREFNLVNKSNPNPNEFDLNLLITLLTNLFRDKIEEPKLGWENFPLAKDDYTSGADLIRLRRVRNNIIGHKVKARLSSSEFTEIWTETENVLLRLISIVSHEKEQKLKHKLAVYKTKSLDTLAVQNALVKVQLWYEEVSNVQRKVEDLAKKAQELMDFFQKIPQQYQQYSALLVDCGRKILMDIWDRECEKCRVDIKSLLKKKREALLADPNCAESADLLFPKDRNKHFNAAEVDIAVLATILVCLFDLGTDEKGAICQLRQARTDYAHTAFSSNDTFMKRWAHLIMTLYKLLNGLSKEKQGVIQALIERYIEGLEERESSRFMDELSAHGKSLKSFLDIYEETMDDLKKALKKMEEEGIPFGEEKVVVLKMFIRGTSQENSEIAETIVESVMKQALKMTGGSNSYSEISKAVGNILDHIQSIDGVTLLSSDRGCIILSFKCTSYGAVNGLLDYFEDVHFESDRKYLQERLFYELKSEFEVRVYFTQESKQRVLTSLGTEKKRKEGYIPVSISCKTTTALREVHKQFTSSVTTSNLINDTADAISKELNEKCKVEIKLETNNSLLAAFSSDSSSKPSSESIDELKSEQTPSTGCQLKSADKLSYRKTSVLQRLSKEKNIEPRMQLNRDMKEERERDVPRICDSTAAKVHELTKEISSLKEKLELEREKYRKALEEIEELRRKLAATKSTQNTSNDDSFMSHVVTGATAGGTVGSVGGIVGSVVGGAGGAVTGAAIGIVRAFSSRR